MIFHRTIDRAISAVFERTRETSRKLETENSQLRNELHEWRRSYMLGMMKELGHNWTATEIPPNRDTRHVDDPVYGRLTLDGKLATVLAHPIVQRLNHVKQLSFTYAEFPAAAHTRLSHSLGAARKAELALEGMLQRGDYYVVGEDHPRRLPDDILNRRQEIVQTAKLVALLHDIGHGPFGHALDSYIGFRQVTGAHAKPDKLYTNVYIRTLLAPTLEQMGFSTDTLTATLDPNRHARLSGIDHLIADVVDSSLDVDRMDYLVRDAHMTGLMMGFTNTQAIIDSMRPVQEQDAFVLAFDEAAIGYIEHFLLAREAMFFNCYEHPRKKAAERAFIRLIDTLLNDTSIGIDADDLFKLTDEEVMTVVRGLSGVSEQARNLARLLTSDVEFVVVHEVGSGRKSRAIPADQWLKATFASQPEEVKKAEALLERVRFLILSEFSASEEVRAWIEDVLTSRPTRLRNAYIQKPEAWEQEIAASSIGAERAWQIQVVVPAPEVYLQQHSAVNLLCWRDERYTSVPLFEISAVLKEVLSHFNAQRARIRVMAPADLSRADRKRISEAATEVLGR